MQYAEDIWYKMKDTGSVEIKMTHDGYLKLFQLTKPLQAIAEDYDIIMVDEAQDLTPGMC